MRSRAVALVAIAGFAWALYEYGEKHQHAAGVVIAFGVVAFLLAEGRHWASGQRKDDRSRRSMWQ